MYLQEDISDIKSTYTYTYIIYNIRKYILYDTYIIKRNYERFF